MYKYLVVDVSENCGAMCPWCTTGVANRAKINKEKKFMPLQSFKDGMQRLYSLGLIDSNTSIELYNWGEPLLNPDIDGIIAHIISLGNPYHISTNLYNLSNFHTKEFGNIEFFMVSLSAFTQQTYDKIHALNLQKVLHNIDDIYERLHKVGLQDRLQINFHVYKFNMNEMLLAKQYFQSKGITIIPRLAYFNDYDQMQQFFTDTMDENMLKEATQQLHCDTMRQIAQNKPQEGWICPEITDKLVFGYNWDIIPCCRLSRVHAMGNLYDMTAEEIVASKNSCTLCQQCVQSGQSYLVHNMLHVYLDVDHKYHL